MGLHKGGKVQALQSNISHMGLLANHRQSKRMQNEEQACCIPKALDELKTVIFCK